MLVNSMIKYHIIIIISNQHNYNKNTRLGDKSIIKSNQININIQHNNIVYCNKMIRQYKTYTCPYGPISTRTSTSTYIYIIILVSILWQQSSPFVLSSYKSFKKCFNSTLSPRNVIPLYLLIDPLHSIWTPSIDTLKL